MNVAVIGAGFLGSLAALQLARLGHDVTLLDRAADYWSGASGVGEGKVHLGYVYLRASRGFLETTVRAALVFRHGVEAALGRHLDWTTLRGSDFIYRFGAGSTLGPDDFRRHAAIMATIQQSLADETGDDYLGRPLGHRGLEHVTADDHGFLTPEMAIDVPRLRHEVVATVQRCPTIDPHFHVDIVAAHRTAAGWMLGTVRRDSPNPQHMGPFAIVVNCAWEGAERLDAIALGQPPRRRNYRLRRYLTGHTNTPPAAYTIIHGAFGDFASFPDGRAYMSWYPAGLLGFTVSEEPPASWRDLCETRPASAEETAAVVRGLKPYVPEVEHVHDVRVSARIVVADGETDITEPNSDLHDRDTVSIEETAGWIRPRSPKLSTAPHASMLLAEIMQRLHGSR